MPNPGDLTGNAIGQEQIGEGEGGYTTPVISAELKDAESSRKAFIGVSGTVNVQAFDSNVLWPSNWGVTGTYTSLVSGSITSITDAPPAGQKIVITDILMSNSGPNGNVIIKEETSGFPLFIFLVPTVQTFNFYPRSKIKLPTAGKKVQAISSQAGMFINIGYYFEP